MGKSFEVFVGSEGQIPQKHYEELNSPQSWMMSKSLTHISSSCSRDAIV